ncbi:MAG: zf-HC2 domain-containing protein [Micromonosporaceae bacterium]|nr:zf-HC2 domain-containing protein [Micromonosporaceae bacterium]
MAVATATEPTDADAPQCTVDAAAYVLGALPMAERYRYEKHLGRCAACRVEVAGLAGLRALLARLRIDDRPPDRHRTG